LEAGAQCAVKRWIHDQRSAVKRWIHDQAVFGRFGWPAGTPAAE